MTFVDALVLGVVEGFTEFLPISSTAHLMLASSLLGFSPNEFLKTFEIAIQVGAIAAVAVLYGKMFVTDRAILARVIVAFIPTGIIGFFLYKSIKGFLLGNLPVALWMLVFGGALLIVFELWRRGRPANIRTLSALTYRQAFIIGAVQSLSVIPGVSRAAATVVGGMLLGIERQAIVQFSFLLAIPTMAAATGYDLFKSAHAFSRADFFLLFVGGAAAFVTALFTTRFLLAFVRTHTFVPFGIYRIVLAGLFLLLTGYALW